MELPLHVGDGGARFGGGRLQCLFDAVEETLVSFFFIIVVGPTPVSGPFVPVERLGQFFQKLLLVTVEGTGYPHVHHHPQVAPAVAIDAGYALAPNPELGPGLGPLGQFQPFVFPVQGRDELFHSERRLCHVDGKLVEQVGIFAKEQGMLQYIDMHVEIAQPSALAPRVAFAGEPDLHSALDSAGDIDGDFAFPPLPAEAAAGGTWCADGAAAALAAGAGHDLGELAENAALGPPDLSVAPASGAGVYGRARLVARARAALTAFKAVDFNFFLDAEYSLFERQHHALLQVSASLGLTGPARSVPKEGIENVAKAAENVESVKGAVPTGVGANSGFAEPVVTGRVSWCPTGLDTLR